MLERAQNKPDVEGDLRQLMKQRLNEDAKSVYIPPQAKPGLHALDNARLPLMEKVHEFINGDLKVFLLLGDSGAGKSTFNRALERDLWKAYKKGGPIPLHINLPAIDKPDQDMIAKQLRRAEFTESQIRELKGHRKFILICDGYDESQQTHNLYITNRLNQSGEWQAKMLISCRTEYLGKDYLDRFQPGDRNTTLETNLFQEEVITPFSVDQIKAYINQYVSIHQPLWEAEEYQQALDQVPSLKELVRNPFLMSLSLEVLPRMMDPGQRLSVTRITKVALYDHFIEHWLERGKKRLGEKALNPQARAAFESLSDEGFTKNGIGFLKKLAIGIYKEQDGHPIVEYSRYRDEGSWKEEFFTREDRQLLREACPLTRNGNQHRFIHRSILEYGLARAVFDPQDYKEKTLQPPSHRRGSTSSAWSFEIQGDIETVASDGDCEPDINSPLAWRSFVNESSILQFLEERVQQEPVFKQQLLAYIENSKRDKKWRTAAANAITILIRVGVEFRFEDLEGIRIPGADLSNGVFESSNLQGADLRKTNLRNVWFHGADLSKAQMAGVQFGELPFISFRNVVGACTYSPNGESFAVGLVDGTIDVYATSDWQRTWTTTGHSDYLGSIAYSPNGDMIVSGFLDNTVKLWDVTTGHCRRTIRDRHIKIRSQGEKGGGCADFSPQGNSVAASGNDDSVRIWDIETGECSHVLSGHTTDVKMVVYSPRGDTIASNCLDSTVRLWHVASGVCHVLIHTNLVTSVGYSPQGDLLASAGEDKSVKVWDVETGQCRHNLAGHSQSIKCIMFSPKGDQLASGSQDETLQLWDVKTGAHIRTLSCRGAVLTLAYSPQGDQVASNGHDNSLQVWDTEAGECRYTLIGHVDAVVKILYSPKGDQIASVSKGTVRLWNVGTGTSRVISNGHSKKILSVAYLSKKRQVASLSEDGTIRIWDAGTGACIHTLSGHAKGVLSFACSPQEDRIISCSSDGTVRLWDVESGSCYNIFTGHSNEVCDVDFSPQGGQVASASKDETVRLWNVETRKCQHILTGHKGDVNDVVYAPQGDQVASGGADHTVRLWNVGTGACHHTLGGHDGSITSVVYSSNGSWIASNSNDRTVRLWNAATGVCHHVFRHESWRYGYHHPIIRWVAFSPRGDQLASGDDTGVANIWDVESGNCRSTLTDIRGTESFVFLPRFNSVLTLSDTKASIWDTETGECRWNSGTTSIFDENWAPVAAKWITSDTGSFVTGGTGRTVRLWEVMEEGGGYLVRLRWGSPTGQLGLEGARIRDAEGLSQLNRQLLKQRGAVGEPTLRLRETGKKIATLGSAASKFKVSLTGEEQNSSASSDLLSEESLRQQIELGKDSQKENHRGFWKQWK